MLATRLFAKLMRAGLCLILCLVANSVSYVRVNGQAVFSGIYLNRDGKYLELQAVESLVLAVPGRDIPYTLDVNPKLYIGGDLATSDFSRFVLRSLQKGGRIEFSINRVDNSVVALIPKAALPPDQYCILDLLTVENWCFEIVANAVNAVAQSSVPSSAVAVDKYGVYLYDNGKMVELDTDLTNLTGIYKTSERIPSILVKATDISKYQTDTPLVMVTGGNSSALSVNEQGKVFFHTVNDVASQAGVRAGDILTEVDGQSIDGLSFGAVEDFMAGEIGSALSITILSNSEYKTITLNRDPHGFGNIYSKYTVLDSNTILLQPHDTLTFGIYCLNTGAGCFEVGAGQPHTPPASTQIAQIVPQDTAISTVPPCQMIHIDQDATNGVISGNFAELDKCSATIEIVNERPYWVNYRITPDRDGVTLNPAKGTATIFAPYHVIPPNGTVTYAVQFTAPGQKVFVDVDVNNLGNGARNMLYVQAVLDTVTALTNIDLGKPTQAVFETYPVILDAISSHTHLNNAMNALLEKPSNLSEFKNQMDMAVSLGEIDQFATELDNILKTPLRDALIKQGGQITGLGDIIVRNYTTAFSVLFTGVTAGTVIFTSQ